MFETLRAIKYIFSGEFEKDWKMVIREFEETGKSLYTVGRLLCAYTDNYLLTTEIKTAYIEAQNLQKLLEEKYKLKFD